MDMREKKIDGKVIFEGHVVKVELDDVLCPNGNKSKREIVRHNGGAAILCVTPDEKILLEKQYRYAYDEVIYEIPAGKLEKGENPYSAAIRELEEETGYKAKELEHLIDIYPTCGYSSEIIHTYLALNTEKTHTHFDEDEIIETYLFTIDEIKEMILKGEIKDAKTIVAFTYYLMKYKK